MSKSTATLINKESFSGSIKTNDGVARTTNICHACGQKLPKTSSSSQRVGNDDEEDDKRQPPNVAESRLEKSAKYLSETEKKIRKIDKKLDAVIDPLEEYSDASLAAKPKINSTKRSRLLDPKQSARSLSFTDSDDENVSKKRKTIYFSFSAVITIVTMRKNTSYSEKTKAIYKCGEECNY